MYCSRYLTVLTLHGLNIIVFVAGGSIHAGSVQSLESKRLSYTLNTAGGGVGAGERAGEGRAGEIRGI